MTVTTVETLGVAEAKQRFSELIDRVRHGERFVVARRGKPVLALVPADQAADPAAEQKLGLLAFVGLLADFDEEEGQAWDEMVKEIYAARRRARDRDVPDLE